MAVHKLSDVIFKSVFGVNTKQSNYALARLLSIFLNIAVKSVEILNSERILHYDLKAIRYDILVILENGSYVDVEAMVDLSGSQLELKERMLYYLCCLHADQLKAGEKYDTLKKSYQLILTGTSITSNESFINKYGVVNRKDLEDLFCDCLEIVVVEVNKAAKYFETHKELSDEEAMSVYLGTWSNETNQQLITKEDILMVDKLYSRISKEEWAILEETQYRNAEIEKQAQMKDELRKAEAKGKKLGLIEGKNLGIAEGKNLGLIEGKIQMCQEFGVSKEDTMKRIKNEFDLTDEKVIEYINHYWR